MITASCSPQDLYGMNKSQIGFLLVTLDLIALIVFLLFGWYLAQTQDNYAKMFDQATLEVSDFTIRVKNFPA
jgi:hypothetical protein